MFTNLAIDWGPQKREYLQYFWTVGWSAKAQKAHIRGPKPFGHAVLVKEDITQCPQSQALCLSILEMNHANFTSIQAETVQETNFWKYMANQPDTLQNMNFLAGERR